MRKKRLEKRERERKYISKKLIQTRNKKDRGAEKKMKKYVKKITYA